ncbi:MAG: SO_0444 family Cu/Zn efflux transporter [Campylobacterales bacterium]|nr:SO_0444 family Cu/Zn efflux transporter [Campylobacterales bacterium]
MDIIIHFFEVLWQLSCAMAPYILFGLIFAGFLHEWVPETLVTKHLGKNNILSVVKSTLFGIPLPVCSCGVIPLATAIKKSGASKGATLSFLISTPITGIDSILATYGIFGWVFTIYRIFSSLIIAMIAGILSNLIDADKSKPKNHFSISSEAKTGLSPFVQNTALDQKPQPQTSCCSNSSCCNTSQNHKSFSFKAALQYAFVTLLGDIAKPLFWGLIIGALITVSIPDNLSELLKNYTWLSYLIVIIIAVPMYVCATASLPIAAGLMLSGVSAGAAFVFLSAGPATNTVTIGVVKKMMGNRSLLIYLGSIIIGSILFGLGLDMIFDQSMITPASLIHLHEETTLVDIGSSILLWGPVIYFMVKKF